MADARHMLTGLNRLQRRFGLLGKAAVQRLRPVEPKLTVFIAGTQRSGTNMMMDVLERSMETDVYHEHDPRAFVKYRMRPVEDIRSLQERSVASHFVIKSLLDLQDLPSLMDTFGPAKTIWLLRDFNDVVNSMLKSFRNQSQQILRIAADRTSDEWLAQGISNETHARIRDLADDKLDNASAAALLWYIRNVIFFDKGLNHDSRVKLVAYESLVTAPHVHFPEIFAFLRLRYSTRISRGIYATSIRKGSPPAIREPVRQLCEDLLFRFRQGA